MAPELRMAGFKTVYWRCLNVVVRLRGMWWTFGRVFAVLVGILWSVSGESGRSEDADVALFSRWSVGSSRRGESCFSGFGPFDQTWATSHFRECSFGRAASQLGDQ